MVLAKLYCKSFGFISAVTLSANSVIDKINWIFKWFSSVLLLLQTKFAKKI